MKYLSQLTISIQNDKITNEMHDCLHDCGDITYNDEYTIFHYSSIGWLNAHDKVKKLMTYLDTLDGSDFVVIELVKL